MTVTTKQRGYEKLKRIGIEVVSNTVKHIKPKIRPTQEQLEKVHTLKRLISDQKLNTVCEEASCPNLLECYSNKIATFMIMGDKCTRRCAFCDVAHGKPDPLDPEEPYNLMRTVKTMGLRYVVITSVDRDDLLDGGASHFKDCIVMLRQHIPHLKIEILVPDFKKRMQRALDELKLAPPDVFNHNIETVPRLYKVARVGSDYQHSLALLQTFHQLFPNIPTKSGVMVGLGETDEELYQLFKDLHQHNVQMLTIGQYLAPSQHHLPVKRYLTQEAFDDLAKMAKAIGFKSVASGPLVRSSYHADQQAKEIL